VDIIKDWIEEILGDQGSEDPRMHPDVVYHTKHHWPDRLKSIECAAEACAFVKCLDDDKRCPKPPSRGKKSPPSRVKKPGLLWH
jgi:hypothetical protein